MAVLDASGDPRVAEILKAYEPLITYLRSGKDAGQAAAIAEGWQHVPGDVLGWLNADDFLYPGALAVARRVLSERTDVDVVTGDSVFLDEKDRFTGFHPGVSAPDARILTSNPISQPSTFIRRSAIDRIGGINPDLHYTMDWDLWSRLHSAGCGFASHAGCLSGVRIARGTKTMGFGAARRREVLNLIAPRASAVRKAKVMIGFGLQYVDDRTGLVSRVLGAAKSDQSGGDAEGRLVSLRAFKGRVQLPLAHYGDSRVNRLEITCEGGAFGVTVQGAEARTAHAESVNGVARLAVSIAPAELVRLSLVPQDSAAVRLKSVAMI